MCPSPIPGCATFSQVYRFFFACQAPSPVRPITSTPNSPTRHSPRLGVLPTPSTPSSNSKLGGSEWHLNRHGAQSGQFTGCTSSFSLALSRLCSQSSYGPVRSMWIPVSYLCGPSAQWHFCSSRPGLRTAQAAVSPFSFSASGIGAHGLATPSETLSIPSVTWDAWFSPLAPPVNSHWAQRHLTLGSTRTPPEMPLALSHLPTSSAPFSAPAQAGPVSLVR